METKSTAIANGLENGAKLAFLPAHSIEFDLSNKKISPEVTIELLLDHAIELGASDLFVSCNEGDVEVAIRHLGMVKRVTMLSKEFGHRCMQHLRAMAGMKFHERRVPQDARWIRRTQDRRTINLRLNTIPTVHGESFSIRLLDRASQLRSLDALGLVGPQQDLLVSMLHSPGGMILVTGPTGSGKTTTLYACLQYLNDGKRKIHTIEDPVEYTFEGLHQTQVDESLGATFNDLLRSVLRQSPDVIMIGEIRDRVTAEIAVRAANSGQIVFATLHSPVAAAAIPAMLSLGISPPFLCNCLLGVIGQRLLPILNPKTRVAIDLSAAPRTFEEVRPWLKGDQGRVVYAASPEKDESTYIGRVGVFEILNMVPAIRKLVLEGQPASQIARKAMELGMLDLRRAAMATVAQGFASFDDMFRIIPTGDTWMDE